MGPDNYQLVKEFVSDIIKSFQNTAVGEEGIRFGVTVYSDIPRCDCIFSQGTAAALGFRIEMILPKQLLRDFRHWSGQEAGFSWALQNHESACCSGHFRAVIFVDLLSDCLDVLYFLFVF